MTRKMIIRCYSELKRLVTFEDRFRYLQLHGKVGADTFGFDRVFNQMFYRSKEWKQLRHRLITRDLGCDLGVPDYDIHGAIYIHHMNPITVEDIDKRTDILLNPEFLICTSFNTHNAIHYGDESLLPKPLVERGPNDTCPWKQERSLK